LFAAVHAAAAAPDPQPPAPAPARMAKGVGVITEINPSDATLTLKHEPIPALGWPSMTMPFRANPPTLLKGLKVGQKIAFDTNEGHGLPEITAIRKP
jgi:Cu(I)/Ag(I) efflux system protein CusF